MSSPRSGARWIGPAVAVVVAGIGGYGIARFTSRPAAPPPPPAATAPGPATLQIAPAEIAAAKIAVEPTGQGNLSEEILAPATVMAAPNGEAVVTAHAAGAVVRLYKRLGDAVRAGETLALVESKEASLMAADRSVADAKVGLAAKVAAREKSLYDQRVSPRADLEAAQAGLITAQAEARRARAAAGAAHLAGDGRSVAVVSPLSGRIAAQAATLGAFVQPEAELFRIADPRFVQIEAHVTAADAAHIQPGDAAMLSSADGPLLSAVVRSVTPTLTEQTRSATVVLALVGDARLTPGSVLQARIMPKAAAPIGIVIPDEAVQTIDGRLVVFLRTPKGFVVQPVRVGSRSAGRAVIASGLTPGQAIATRNAFLLKAELGKGSGDEE